VFIFWSFLFRFFIYLVSLMKYDKKNQQGGRLSMNATPNDPEQERVARSPGGPQTKIGQAQGRARTG
jgi:hypothetical protein